MYYTDCSRWELQDVISLAYVECLSDKMNEERDRLVDDIDDYPEFNQYMERVYYVDEMLRTRQLNGDFKPTQKELVEYMKEKYNTVCTEEQLLEYYKPDAFK